MADMLRQEREIESMNSARQSDLHSQNEAPNNSNISMLKSSPRLFHKQVSHHSNSSNPNIVQKNFILQEGTNVGASQLTSHDASNMQSLLNAMKHQLPASSQNVNAVKIDLDKTKKIVFSPKGYATAKVQSHQSSKRRQNERASSNDESKNFDKKVRKLAQDHSHHTPNIQANKEKNLNSSNFNSKNVKSPQPSSNIISSNHYLKSLQSQEFQLKDKAKRKNLQVFNTLQQSVDPIITLPKDPKSTKADSKYYTQSNNMNKDKGNNSSRKQLKINLKEVDEEIKDQYFSNSTSKVKPDNPQQSCRSSKNLYSAFNKAQLLDEINDVNECLDQMDIIVKRKASSNILEEALTSKSQPNSSYQTSPKFQKISIQGKVEQHQKHHEGIRPMKSASIFRTASIVLKEEGQIQMTHQMMPTVRNTEFPLKKMSFIQAERDSMLLAYQTRVMQHEDENLDLVIIDFPRQMPTKESQNYVRRDLNQDTFCKINSHHGDMDNDPHTPKSSGSLGSIEKRSNKKKKKMLIDEFQSLILHPARKPADEQQFHVQNLAFSKKYTPLRFHSASVDDVAPPSNFILEAAPLQSSRRFEEMKDDSDNKLRKAPQGLKYQKGFPKKHEAVFDDADLKDTEDKFTSRDINFNRLKHFMSDNY